MIFAKRSNTLLGKGIVTGNYVFDDLRQEYKNVRAVKWLQVGEWEHPGNAVAKRGLGPGLWGVEYHVRRTTSRISKNII